MSKMTLKDILDAVNNRNKTDYYQQIRDNEDEAYINAVSIVEKTPEYWTQKDWAIFANELKKIISKKVKKR